MIKKYLASEKISKVIEFYEDELNIELIADFFKVFGDPTRIKILSALDLSEMNVQSIADLLEMTKSAISHQLRKLKDAHLVKTRRSGKEIYYSLDDEHVRSVLNQGVEHIIEKNTWEEKNLWYQYIH